MSKISNGSAEVRTALKYLRKSQIDGSVATAARQTRPADWYEAPYSSAAKPFTSVSVMVVQRFAPR